jgi:hypothetical protein
MVPETAHITISCQIDFCSLSRVAGSHSAVGAALGPTDLHSLVHLLAGPAANLAAASLQLPAASLPSSAGQQAMQAQQQQQQQAAAAAGGDSRVGSGVLSLDGPGCRSLSPGVRLAAGDCLAESITLRGVCHGMVVTLNNVGCM